MGAIHDAYVQAIKERALKACAEKVIEKLEHNGVIIDDEKRSQIIDCIVFENMEEFPTSFENRSEEIKKIDFSDLDNSDLKEAMRDANKGCFDTQTLINVGRDLSITYCINLNESWESIYKERNEEQQVLEKERMEIWGIPISCLDKMLFLLVESGNSNVDDINEKKEENPRTNKALWLLYARMCQLMHEILQLIRSGYADGALSRWRTMHEVVVTALFIAENGEDVAQRYLDHESVETLKEIRTYEEYCDFLGLEHLGAEEIETAERKIQELVEKYGEGFRRDYGWAESCFDNKRATFSDIEKSVDCAHMRGYYKMASNGIHANAKGTTFRLSQPNNTDTLIAGPSVFGLFDPILRTAHSICIFQSTISMVWGSLDNLVVACMMNNLLDQIDEELIRIEAEFYGKERGNA